MKIEKTYTGTLNIDKEKVSLDTNIVYQGIQIEYVGTINITSLLPNDYIVSSGNNKIIIAKLIKNDNNLQDLFTYKGLAIISKCILITEDLQKHILYINKSNIDTYGMLNNSWDNLTRNYEDLKFDGNNNKKRYLFKRRIKDEDTGIITETREIRKN
jgi:hypothetical protein